MAAGHGVAGRGMLRIKGLGLGLEWLLCTFVIPSTNHAAILCIQVISLSIALELYFDGPLLPRVCMRSRGYVIGSACPESS